LIGVGRMQLMFLVVRDGLEGPKMLVQFADVHLMMPRFSKLKLMEIEQQSVLRMFYFCR
jgi:hypothetical protein